jgi:hypothetical protein
VVVKGDIDWERKVSKPQKLVKDFLFPYWKSDQVTEEFVIPGSIFRADLFNITKRIIVEVSPDEYHVDFNPWLHKDTSKFLAKIKSDEDKRNWCERNKIKLIELYNEDIKNLSQQYISEKYQINL